MPEEQESYAKSRQSTTSHNASGVNKSASAPVLVAAPPYLYHKQDFSATVTLIYGFVKSNKAAIETIPSAGPVASLVRFCVVSTYTAIACYKLLQDLGTESADELLTGTLSAASPPFLLSVALKRSIRA